MNIEPSSHCALCGEAAALHRSHVLPAFIFRWFRESSATGHIRFSEAPDKRVQDGIKLPLLCSKCEGRLSRFETAFATNLFHPWNSDSGKRIRYGDWLLKFCVSISWRVLTYAADKTGLEPLAPEQKEMAKIASDRWSQFILGSEPHPGQFEQHLLHLDPIVSHSLVDLPNNINRYLLRAVEMDLPAGEKSAYTYAKLGKFALFGFIQPPARKWIGTKVHVRAGVIGPGEYQLPPELMSYFHDRATRYGEIYSRISEKQLDKIESDATRDVDRLRSSATAEAMFHDRRLFGTEAILRRPKLVKKDTR
jgi:hypothetical protein